MFEAAGGDVESAAPAAGVDPADAGLFGMPTANEGMES